MRMEVVSSQRQLYALPWEDLKYWTFSLKFLCNSVVIAEGKIFFFCKVIVLETTTCLFEFKEVWSLNPWCGVFRYYSLIWYGGRLPMSEGGRRGENAQFRMRTAKVFLKLELASAMLRAGNGWLWWLGHTAFSSNNWPFLTFPSFLQLIFLAFFSLPLPFPCQLSFFSISLLSFKNLGVL